MLGKFFKKVNSEVEKVHYYKIKQLVSTLPEGPGWAATYDKELSTGIIKQLEKEGVIVSRNKNTGGWINYNISKA